MLDQEIELEPEIATQVLIAAAVARTVELGWVKKGERVGVTAGLPSGKPGTTSLLQIQDA